MGKRRELGASDEGRVRPMVVMATAETGGVVEAGIAASIAAGISPEDGQAADQPGAQDRHREQREQIMTVRRVGYAPIVRVDAERREIELCATSEAVDAHGTIFDYAASKDAFTRWIGNVREMHDRKAVGARVAVRCDDEARRVYVRVRISRGAQDTWEKVVDGTLRGASIGARDVVWQRQKRRVAGQERLLDVAVRYDLAELSLVDNPSNPDTLGVTIVRGAAPDVALLDALDSTPDSTPAGQGEAEGGERSEDVPTEDAPVRVGIVGMEGRRGQRRARVEQVAREMAPHAVSVAVPVKLPQETPQEVPSETPMYVQPALWEPEQTTQKIGALGTIEERIAREALAQGWAAIARDKDGSLDGVLDGLDEAQESDEVEGTPADIQSVGMESHEAEHRAQGPFSPNAAGYPDMGTPQEAETRPTATLGMTVEGNALERLHLATKGLLIACGCPLCEAALAALDAEPKDADAAGEATEVDAGIDAPGTGAVGRRMARRMAVRDAALTRALAEGLHGSARRLERLDQAITGVQAIVQAGIQRIAHTQEELRRRVESLEAQPMPGGPAARGMVGNLHNSYSPQQAAQQVEEQEQALRATLQSLAGRLRDPQAQVAVAAELIRLQQAGAPRARQ